MREQYPALTSLRFLAALLVFLFHFPLPGAVWDVVAREGHVGVNIFFVLSGFLITLRYGEAVGRGEVRLAPYFVRRAARILPLYYVVFAIGVLTSFGAPLFSWARLPEWTLTQALFGESISQLAVPTSWSLTVEECFYAAAPLVFVAIAGLRFRRPHAPVTAAVVVAGALTVALLGVGAALWTLLDGRGPGFLATPDQVLRNTIFGRFYDFAIGIVAAVFFESAAGQRMRDRLGRPAVGGILSVIAIGVIVLAQSQMHRAGGIFGADWLTAYLWHLPLAPAAAALILALTAAANPLTRLLAREPFVYLGKVSYALYLIQATPVFKNLFYRLLPNEDVLSWCALYLGMTAISIVLYEVVEEPGRDAVLRVAGMGGDGASDRRRAMRLAPALAASGALVFVSLAGSEATLTEIRVRAEAGDVMHTEDDDVRPSGPGHWVVRIPRRWREGWGEDDRAPQRLRVFADGQHVAFHAREHGGIVEQAFFRDPRAGVLTVRLGEKPKRLVVVRETPALALRLRVRAWQRYWGASAATP